MSSDPMLNSTGSKFQTTERGCRIIYLSCFFIIQPRFPFRAVTVAASGIAFESATPPLFRGGRRRTPRASRPKAVSQTTHVKDLSRRNRNSDRNANGSYSGFRTFYFISCKFTFFSVKENVLPTPSSLRTVIRSPCASTICLTMASPSPVPPCSRDRPLSVR